jgi:tetratricopeptide (TPR) repeat protein
MNSLDKAKQLFLDGLQLLQAEQFELAESKLAQAHILVPDRLSVLVNLSAVQIKLQQFEQAKASAQRALALDATHADIWLNLGIAEKGMGSHTEALHCLDQALRFNPALAASWMHKGWIHIAKKQAANAEACFNQAAQMNPEFAATWQPDACISLGALYYNSQQVEAAISPYQQALASGHHTALALQSLLIVFAELKQHQALAALISQHEALIQKDALCNELLGFYHFNTDHLELAQHHFRQAALLSEHQPNTNNPQEWPVSEPRLRHDFEQLSLLKARGLQNASSQAALDVITRCKKAYSDQDQAALIQTIGAYQYLPDTPFTGTALGANDFQKIEHDFKHNNPKLVVIDNFLSNEALLQLRKFCEEATVWKRSYPNGYLGSFMASGFCSPVILEIARQLKIAMPNVVGTQDLRQAWGFKYDQGMKGINLHADFARVNINFWLTPDDACLDPTTGGIVVYDTPPPKDWSFEKANADSATIQQYLDAQQAKTVRVPYKMNRCVLFDSTYFHTTDDIHFKAGYENRRINCTLLFGKGL